MSSSDSELVRKEIRKVVSGAETRTLKSMIVGAERRREDVRDSIVHLENVMKDATEAIERYRRQLEETESESE